MKHPLLNSISKWLLVVPAMLVFMACGSDSEEEQNAVGQIVEEAVEERSLEELVEAFKECQANKEGPYDCQNYIARAACSYYGICDMTYAADNSFWSYEEVVDAMAEFDEYELIGDADDQDACDEAQKLANEGTAVFAVNTSEKKRGAALVIKGETTMSNSWGVKCPVVAFFFPNRPEDSFVGKGLNYAWSSPDNVKLYYRVTAPV